MNSNGETHKVMRPGTWAQTVHFTDKWCHENSICSHSCCIQGGRIFNDSITMTPYISNAADEIGSSMSFGGSYM